MREKYCWLAGGYWLVLVWCERKTLLAGCREQSVHRAAATAPFPASDANQSSRQQQTRFIPLLLLQGTTPNQSKT